jgi:hypothetical protein
MFTDHTGKRVQKTCSSPFQDVVRDSSQCIVVSPSNQAGTAAARHRAENLTWKQRESTGASVHFE